MGGSGVRWSDFEADRVDGDLVWIVRATCLLESRSARYAGYLTSVLPDRLHDRVAAWAEEEAHHGRALRRWLELADPGWAVDAAFAAFDALPYHAHEVAPRRGGPRQELVSRCVVEALASGFYAGLARRAQEPVLSQICERLLDDERRHLREFAAMRDELPALPRSVRLRVAFDRIRELGDDQITFAAHCSTDTGGPYVRRRVRRRYLRQVRRIQDVESMTHTLCLLAEAAGTQRTDPPRPVRRGRTRILALPATAVLRLTAVPVGRLR